MHHLARLHPLRRKLTVVLILVLVVAGPLAGSRPAAAQTRLAHGMICTTGATTYPTFTLTTREGYVGLGDGNVVYMWGFSAGDTPFQYPGPVLCVNEGDKVTVVLHNTLDVPVSIVFPGQDNVYADGAPAQPVFDGAGLASLVQPAPSGGSVTYNFTAAQPGSFIYESGTEPSVQVQMGLFGMLVVRPALGAGYAYNRADTQFNPEKEYVLMLSEIEPLLHQAIENGYPFDMRTYTPRYWLYNGRGFPDTVAPNYAGWLPGQPYSSLVHLYPHDELTNPLPALIRYAGFGSEVYPHHPHGNHGRIIGRDGHLLEGPATEDLSFEKFSVPIGPGQTWDSTFDWRDAENFDPFTNPIPVTIPQSLNLAYGPFWGSPYLGLSESLPPGTVSLNQCGEYYHIAHSHALHQITGWGIVLIGQVTFTRIDPPLPNLCP